MAGGQQFSLEGGVSFMGSSFVADDRAPAAFGEFVGMRIPAIVNSHSTRW
jgi:hypothetical protein